jgi:uncharacterized protein YegL
MPNKLDELFSNWNNDDVKITRKVPICLCIDVSGSMNERDGSTLAKIDEVNKYVNVFLDYVRNDERAKKISDICIITFGGTVNVVTGYTSIDKITSQSFKASGGTPLGGAVDKAVELLDLRRKYYIDNNIEHWKPILLLMSDGEPTDSYQSSAANFSKRVLNKELKVFPVGMGTSFNLNILKQFAPDPNFQPKQIKTSAEYEKLFNLLSSSSSRPEDDPLAKWWNEAA